MSAFAGKHVAAFLFASALGLGLAPAAFAQEEPMHGPMGMHGGGPGMALRGLDLSEAQRDQIFKIHYDQMPAMREQMKQVRHAREELMKASSAERFDDARARQAADALGKAVSAMAVMRAQTMNRVRAVLTPEQRSRLDERMQRHGRMAPR
jgi:Spy/CpxP family protein refolding chaperone